MNTLGRRQMQSLVILCLFLGGIAFVTMRRTGDEEAIVTDIVETLVKAAENKKIGPFKKHFSDQFEDEHGRTKDEVLNILRAIFLRHPKISLHIFSLNFAQSTNPNIKEVDLTLLMSDATLPDDKGEFRITFRLDGGDWKIWSAQWGEGYGYR